MKYGDLVIWPEYNKGETDENVLIALAMAAYELSEPIESDDLEELFPSKGCLLPHEAREFIREKKYGLELVIHIAFQRLCMLEVHPERRCRDGAGNDGIFIINDQRYGQDVEALVVRANGIMYDLLRDWDRMSLVLWRLLGNDVSDEEVAPPPVHVSGMWNDERAASSHDTPYIPELRTVTPPPWPSDAFDE